MPVRSINLKLIVPRGATGIDVRQSLWDTHAAVNAATRYYEERLLLLRGLSYELRDDEAPRDERRQVPQTEVERQALALAREAQRANLDRAGLADAALGSDQDVLTALQRLYAWIVPDETAAASAQEANAFLSPLCAPRSRGFGAAADKLNGRAPIGGHAIKHGVIAGSISFARTGGTGLPGRRRSAVMEQQFVGLDVSQAETAVCVVDAAGIAVWQGKCASAPGA